MENLYLIENRSSRNEMWCAADYHNFIILSAHEARNLGVVMDSHLNLTTHINMINNICRSECLAIYKIGQIRRFIDRPTAERLVHAFVTRALMPITASCTDFRRISISKLQRVQKAAASLAGCTGESKRKHRRCET